MSLIFNSFCLLVSRSKFSFHRVYLISKHDQRLRKINKMGFYRTASSHTMTSSNLSKLFEGKVDRFKGITVDSKNEQCEDQEFPQKLKDSLKAWTENGNRGIWFKVHLSQSDWVPILAKNGFKFHHAHEEYVMMVCWLPKSESNNIPHYAHTMVGVGAVVINDENQVLVVKERYYPHSLPHYKLPGGYVEPGENIVDAAIREVYEETNIKTKFESVLALRHGHGGMFACSDIYITVHLKAVTVDIEKCDREILESKWMDVTEYLEHPHIHELNKFFVKKYLEYEKRGIKVNCFHGIHQILKKPYTVYSITNRELEFTNNDVDISKF
ncbi:uncharacterized protein [Diabrotica undecimpunctata]|uniref:uncharacterized protein isoform X1 n=2 Tax=Diabrotica undecimpunctata TaxID=50387 RepID=UPI003B63C762